MEVVNSYIPGDPGLIDRIVYELKSQGIFDKFRKECLSDVDTKPAYQNLRQRVEGSVNNFLRKQTWKPDMNKNQVREMLRKNIYESGYLETGVERIVDQVVNPKINTLFLPQVEEVVYKCLGIKKPTTDSKKDPLKINITQSDLLPTDLEAVSPASTHSEKIKFEPKTEDHVDEAKNEDDESPPFEPLDEQNTFLPQEENSVDSHMSGFSGLASHESNHSSDMKNLQIDLSNQDSQVSQNSSESRLSIVTSEENTKMEVCEDTNKKTENGTVKDSDKEKKAEYKKPDKLEKKDDKYKSRSSDKYKYKSEKSDKDRKYEKERKHSSSSNSKDKSRSTSSSSSRDKDRSKDRRDSKSSSSKDKEREKIEKDRSEKDRDKDKKNSSKSSSKDRSSYKDSSKERSKSSSSYKESKDGKSKSTESKREESKSKSSSSDKYRKDEKSSKHSSNSKRDREKKRDSRKDDHYSSKDKSSNRRSTDRDSNDGNSSRQNNPNFSSENSSSNSQKGQEFIGSNGHRSADSASDAVESQQLKSSEEINRVKLYKPKFASNIHEAMRLMKVRKKLAKLEKRHQLGLANVVVSSNEEVKTGKESEVEEEKEEEVVLQSTNLSKESWEALEARLYQEMSQINYNSYGYPEDGDEEDFKSYTKKTQKTELQEIAKKGSVEVKEKEENVKQQDENKKQSEEENLKHEEKIEKENQKETAKEDLKDEENLSQGAIIEEKEKKQDEKMEEKDINRLKTENEEKLDQEPSLNETVEEKDSKDTNSEQISQTISEENKLKTSEMEQGKELYEKSKADESNILIEKQEGKEEMFQSPEKTNSSIPEPHSSECKYLERPSEMLEKNRIYLSSFVKKLELEIDDGSLPEGRKSGKKRKLSENSDTKNNNKKKISFDDISVQSGQSSENSSRYATAEKPTNSTDVQNDSFPLPLSPAESDISNDKKEEQNEMKSRRSSLKSQRYSSEDLYKPRASFASSRRRGLKN